MNARVDYLLVLFSQNFVSALTQLCQKKSVSYRLITTPEEAQEALNFDQHCAVWVEIADEHPFGLQLFEWLKTQNLQSETGIVFTKNYEKSVKKAITFGATHFIAKQTLAAEDEIWTRLRKSKTQFLTRQQENVVNFTDVTQNRHEQWVCASLASQQWIQSVIKAFQQHDVLTLTGPKGSGKSQLANGLALFGSQGQRVLQWDCEKTPSYAQKDLFLQMLKDVKSHENDLLIIDEVGSLDLELQELVVEFLQGQGFSVEGQRIWPQIKVLMTSTESLYELLDEEKLRDDLCALCQRSAFSILPLSQRRDEITGLANSFFYKNSNGQKRVNQDVIDVLKNYDWPGEVQELKLLVEQLCQTVEHDIIEPQDLPDALLVKNFYSTLEDEDALWELPYQEAKKRALHKFNKAYMKHLLDEAHQNYTVAAEKAGMDRSNFKKLLKKGLST